MISGVNEQTDIERAAELLWQRDQARAELAKTKARNEELERLLDYANEALKAEIERTGNS